MSDHTDVYQWIADKKNEPGFIFGTTHHAPSTTC